MLKRRATLVSKITDGEKRLERITKPLIDGIGDSDDLGQQHKQIAQDVRLWKQELALEPKPLNVVTLRPAAISGYKEALMKLRDIVNNDHRTVTTFASVIRELVKEIRITRGDAKGEIDIQVIGKLRSLLSDTAPRIRVGGLVVAEEGGAIFSHNPLNIIALQKHQEYHCVPHFCLKLIRRVASHCVLKGFFHPVIGTYAF